MAQKERLYYIDWLRILAILFVFLVHTSMPFSTVRNIWLIQFDQTSLPLTMFAGFTYQWVMQLFFFLAGAGACFALASRSPRQYLVERSQRLLIPFLFGSLAFTALQDYVSLASKSQPPGPFLRFYPSLYVSCLRNPALGLLRIDCFSRHLWFLLYLFLFSILLMPLLAWIKSPIAIPWVAWLGDFSQRPGGILIFFLPTALIQAVLRARYPQHQNWSDFFVWMVYFLLGYLFLLDRRLLDSAVHSTYIALVGGIACMVGMSVLLLYFGYAESWEMHPVFSPGFALYQILRSLNTWLWVMFFLGLGARVLNSGHPLLYYGREALLPFYILHHVVIVLLAYAILSWHPSIAIKFLSLGLAGFLITIALYELFVRRSHGLRFLFGLRFAISTREQEVGPFLDGRSELK